MPSAPALRRVLLCGYYGEHNIGDDALLQVLLEQLPAGWEPLVTARDEHLVRQRFNVQTTDRRRLGGVLLALGGCDALVLGGGSLLQDSTSCLSLIYYALLIVTARLRRRPVLLWGQGLGPLHHRFSRLLVRLLLPMATAISWRDPASAVLAARWRIRAHQGTDPVWALPARPWQGAGGPIVLCWRPVQGLDGASWRTYLDALERLLVRIDRQVQWLPFHQDQDRGLLADLDSRGLVGQELRRRSRELELETPGEAMAVFASAGLVVAMRLHGLILAALAGSPCAALSYDPKVAAAAAGIGCPCHDLARSPSADLADTWNRAVDRPLDPAVIGAQRLGSAPHLELLRRGLPARGQG